MNFDKGIKTALFFGKMGILIFSFYFLSFWVYELTGSPSSLLMIGILFSGLFLWMVVLVKSHFRPSPDSYDLEKLKKKENRAHLLLNNLNYDCDKLEEKTSYYFKTIKMYKFLIIFLGGLSTVLIGLDIRLANFMDVEVMGNVIKNSVLILTASITVLTSLFSYWNLEKYWMTHKVILFRLRILKDKVEDAYKKALDVNSPDEKNVNKKVPMISDDELKRFIDERLDILSRLSEHWDLALNSSPNGNQNPSLDSSK